MMVAAAHWSRSTPYALLRGVGRAETTCKSLGMDESHKKVGAPFRASLAAALGAGSLWKEGEGIDEAWCVLAPLWKLLRDSGIAKTPLVQEKKKYTRTNRMEKSQYLSRSFQVLSLTRSQPERQHTGRWNVKNWWCLSSSDTSTEKTGSFKNIIPLTVCQQTLPSTLSHQEQSDVMQGWNWGIWRRTCG